MNHPDRSKKQISAPSKEKKRFSLKFLNYELVGSFIALRFSFPFQPPAFPAETSESLKEILEEKYLLPELDPDEFSVENSGRQWVFDWFDIAKVHLEPSAPRSVVAPSWEVPFRRSKKTGSTGLWDPSSVQVYVVIVYILYVFLSRKVGDAF